MFGLLSLCFGPGQSSLDKGLTTLSLLYFGVGHLSTFGIREISMLSGIHIIPKGKELNIFDIPR